MKSKKKSSSSSSSTKIRLVEVGPRDGLQNEEKIIPLNVREKLIQRLVAAGLRHIEIGAFVSPQRVPQMAGSAELVQKMMAVRGSGSSDLIGFKRGVSNKVLYSALVPNRRGMEDALPTGIRHVAVFGSASESFSKSNINCTIEESLQRFKEVVAMAKPEKIPVRGYLSVCFGCPFEGKVSQARVIRLCERMLELGIYEVSIGDTIGVADPAQVRKLLGELVKAVGADHLALHFHDTRGTALANILASLDLGLRTFDSSIGGLGGCPYAPAATGNVATEDVVYMLERMGYRTGVDLEQLIEINRWMSQEIGRELPSRVGRAGDFRIKPVDIKKK